MKNKQINLTQKHRDIIMSIAIVLTGHFSFWLSATEIYSDVRSAGALELTKEMYCKKLVWNIPMGTIFCVIWFCFHFFFVKKRN
jgi:hypothetical protein